MTVNITLNNQTGSNVFFGLWNGPSGDSGNTQKMPAEKEGVKIDLAHANARIIGVWTEKGDLYPSNEDPFITGYDFQDNESYTVTLTTEGLTCELAGAKSASV